MLGCCIPVYTMSSADIEAAFWPYQARCSDVIQMCSDLVVEKNPASKCSCPLLRSVVAGTAVGFSWTRGSCCVVKSVLAARQQRPS